MQTFIVWVHWRDLKGRDNALGAHIMAALGILAWLALGELATRFHPLAMVAERLNEQPCLDAGWGDDACESTNWE